MTPKDYLDRYTYLQFPSPFNSLPIAAPISNYGSGWELRMGSCKPGATIQKEYDKLVRALRVVHHGNPNTPCGERFRLKDACSVSPNKEFATKSLVNAFLGKGSPDEISDTLCLAMLTGRFGMPRDAAGQPPAAATAQAYATSYITLDCNGLVGNYYGGNPEAPIAVYTTWPRRTKIEEVRPGDVVVTHCPTIPHEHVALVQEWTVSGNSAAIRLVEWGYYGGEDAHYTPKPVTQRIQQGPDKSLGVGWSVQSPRNKTVETFRYVFGPQGTPTPRGRA